MIQISIGMNLGLTLLVLFTTKSLLLQANAQNCRPTGYFRASAPPPGQCHNQIFQKFKISNADLRNLLSSNDNSCCMPKQVYFTFQCSPTVTINTVAILTHLPTMHGSRCGGRRQYSENEPVVALSTGWYNGNGGRCGKEIVIKGNGLAVRATVVAECDSKGGCDAAHGYRPPCGYNVVQGSTAVWKALLVPRTQGQLNITWSDA